jgi:DNA mismatch endonuclease (patch repair protein)
MTDVMTSQQRRRCMANIRGRDTKPEVRLRKALWRRGLRYRLHAKVMGRPDFLFVKQKVAVFVDGCFWHRCKRHFSLPKTNAVFWEGKIGKNVHRDKMVTRGLRRLGWRVIRVWEHEVESNLKGLTARISRQLRKR